MADLVLQAQARGASVAPIPMATVATDAAITPIGRLNSSVRLQPESVRLSLHDAIKFKDWEAVRELATDDRCHEPDSWGRLPLVLAIIAEAPHELLQIILEAYPAAVETRMAERDLRVLPLHLAIEQRAEVAVIELLLAAYPDAVRIVNAFEDLPIHTVVKFTADEEMWSTQQMVPYSPRTTAVADSDEDSQEEHGQQGGEGVRAEALSFLGYTPRSRPPAPEGFSKMASLADAADDGAERSPRSWQFEVVHRLLNLDLSTICVKSSEGKLPLRLAVESNAPSEVVLRLLQGLPTYPDACKDVGRGQKLPLHIALERRAPEPLVAALVHAYPQAVHVKSAYHGGSTASGELPLAVAVRMGAPEEVLRQLLPRHVKLSEAQKRDPAREDKRKAAIKREEERLGVRLNEHHGHDAINAAMEADLQQRIRDETIRMRRPVLFTEKSKPTGHGYFAHEKPQEKDTNLRPAHKDHADDFVVDSVINNMQLAAEFFIEDSNEEGTTGGSPLSSRASSPRGGGGDDASPPGSRQGSSRDRARSSMSPPHSRDGARIDEGAGLGFSSNGGGAISSDDDHVEIASTSIVRPRGIASVELSVGTNEDYLEAAADIIGFDDDYDDGYDGGGTDQTDAELAIHLKEMDSSTWQSAQERELASGDASQQQQRHQRQRQRQQQLALGGGGGESPLDLDAVAAVIGTEAEAK